jgi:hypothetical protein
VDLLLDDSPELIPVDEQSDDQIVHTLRLRKADGPAHQPLDPRPQIDVLALNSLHVCLPNDVLLSIHMALVGPPAVGIIPGDAKRLQQRLQAQREARLARENARLKTLVGELTLDLKKSTFHRI